MSQREEAALDQEVFDKTLAAELAKGTDRRVAEGRARSAAVRAYRKVHGEPEREQKAPAAGDRTAPPPTGRVPTPRPGAPDKHRLLALVPPEGIQRVEREQGDRINVWPHLLLEEFIALMIMSAGLVIFSTFVNAPLRELANPNLTPNPSKAPWYFLGLQELLRYFHPMVAGVTIPTFILVGLAVVPFIDRNPSIRPGDRKLAITLFTMLFMFGATLTIIGCFFRGPGFNWVWPWSQGLFFEL